MEQHGRSFLATLLLNFFFGWLGIHRFYTGYVGIGILQLLTGGGFGIWAFIDFIFVCLGRYKDVDNNYLEDYNKTVGYVALSIVVALSLFVLFVTALISVIFITTFVPNKFNGKSEKYECILYDKDKPVKCEVELFENGGTFTSCNLSSGKSFSYRLNSSTPTPSFNNQAIIDAKAGKCKQIK